MSSDKFNPLKIKLGVPLVFTLIVLSVLSINIPWLCLVFVVITILSIVLEWEHFETSLYYYKLKNSKKYYANYITCEKTKTKNKCLNRLIEKIHNSILLDDEKEIPEEHQYGDARREALLFIGLKIFHFNFFNHRDATNFIYNHIHKLNLSKEGYVFCLQQAIFEIIENQPELIEKPSGKEVRSSWLTDQAAELINLNLHNTNFQQAMLNDLPEIQNLKNNLPEDKIRIVSTKAQIDNAMENAMKENNINIEKVDDEVLEDNWKM